MNPRAARAGGVRRSGVGTGTTSLLMIFTVLCFATLAMLSLSTAESNRRIHSRGIALNTSLAAARGEAAWALSELDTELAGLQATWLQEQENYEALHAEQLQPYIDELERQLQIVQGGGTVLDITGHPLSEETLQQRLEGARAMLVLSPDQLEDLRESSRQAYLDAAMAAARAIGWNVDAESLTLTFTLLANQRNQLVTVVQLQPPGAQTRYTVLSQTTVLVGGWHPQQDDGVWVPG